MNMWRKLAVAAALAGASVAAFAGQVVNYTLDPGHTQVRFSWSHLGFSTPGAVFREVTGVIQGDKDMPEKSVVNVSMPVQALDAFVPLLNDHLIRSGEYFKAKEFPVVTFRSTGLQDIDREKGSFKLLGQLTVNGISKEVTLDAKLNKIGPHPFYENAEAVGFNATTRIKRSDFGMGKYAPMVSDELDVTITAEAVESAAFQAAMEKQKKAAEEAKGKAKAKGKSK